MNISPEDLESKGYIPSDSLQHSDIVGFIKPFLYRRNIYMIGYFASSLIPLVVFGMVIGFRLGQNDFDSSQITWFLYGWAPAFLLVPLHEGLHGLAYKILGAKSISYGADLRHLVFYAMANRFVVDFREFRIVALTPFLFIGLGLAILTIFLPPYWNLFSLGMLFMHTLFCGGDFGLLSYFYENRNKNLVTFDDVDQKMSYFYLKPA